MKKRLSPEFDALIETMKAEGRADRREEQQEDRGKKIREWVTIILIAATFVAISLQVHEMVKVYGPIREQAEAQKAAADAAIRQSKSAESQSESAERALTLGQRAWVGPTNILFDAEPQIGKPIEITVQYQNTGREPALGFLFVVNTLAASTADELLGLEPPQVQEFTRNCRNNINKQWVGGSVVYPTTGFSSYSMVVKTKDKFVDKTITTGDKFIFVQGCFVYRTFDKPRYSYFCYFYRKGVTKITNLNICSSGHDAD